MLRDVGTRLGSFSSCDSISSAELPVEQSVGWPVELSAEQSAELLAPESVGDIGGTSLSMTTDYKIHVHKYPYSQNIVHRTLTV
jgi:hypothetical protein